MKTIVISKKQFEKIKEVFEMYNVDRVTWLEESVSSIGPNVIIEFDPKSTIKLDITDVESW